ncbi:MerR family transcriptional regulator [Sphingobium aquiterrae]|uniref:MerR family transcriptional regulator n=1 Tax=Sphingobium aquiterrae TaxID=2038656 RepID=UPI003015F6A0
MEAEFTAAEVSRLAGFEKPWMLGHLEREGIFIRENFQDRRHGRARKYTFLDLLILRSINRMLEIGMRPARIKTVIRKIAEIEGLSEDRNAARALVTTLGVRLFVGKEEAYIIDNRNIESLTASGQLAFGFMIDLKAASSAVISVVDAYEMKKRGNLKVDLPILQKMCAEAGI